MSPASLCLRWSLGPLVALVAMLAPSVASAAACPSPDTSYTGNCGPMFAVPSWTDAGGWNEPSQYSTIQLADVNGDGRDELLGRSDAGIQIYRFDTTLGEWRPQVDGKGVPQLLNDFASFLPSNESDPHNPNNPQYYSTIQAADIDGQPGAEILGRFWDGMRVYKYTPPNGGGIDGGSWSRIGTAGPFSDADGYGDPALYSTIGVAQFKRGDLPLLFADESILGDINVGFKGGVLFYKWDSASSKWLSVYDASADNTPLLEFTADEFCKDPSCYLTVQAADLPAEVAYTPDNTVALMDRSEVGVYQVAQKSDGHWYPIFSLYDKSKLDLPFADEADAPNPDCPFSTGGASGPGSGDCVGSSPSYYETLQAADIDGLEGDEVFARASDGLRVRKWVSGANCPPLCGVQSLPTLTALAGAPSALQPGQWGSIQTGDLDADGKQEVLALDGKGLQAWSYDPAGTAWRQWQPSTPLALGSDPWLSHPEYYSTLQTGDVDGDGRDDVIARGPYGIRTWFYDRRGTGGWERYRPDGPFPSGADQCRCYPAFSGGQAAAYDSLNSAYRAALDRTGTIRDVWTQENAPSTNFSDALLPDLEGSEIGNCSTKTSLAPPQYGSCTPPQGSTGFTQNDWTAVVNEILAEAFAADQVLGFFDNLSARNDELFLVEEAELNSLASTLSLQAAAGVNTQFNPLPFVAGGLGLAASIAGLAPVVGPEISAALWVASEVVSMVPQSSPTVTDGGFSSSLDGLKNQFANILNETVTGVKVMSQQVRQDAGLLALVSQMRTTGGMPWADQNLDTIGIESAANQAFVIWVYKTLLPTISWRYVVTNCFDDYNQIGDCDGPVAKPGIVGGKPNFTIAGHWFQEKDPCSYTTIDGWWYTCIYWQLPDALLGKIWNPLPSKCIYEPGQSINQWTFDCPSGDDVKMSVGQNAWGFNSACGDFVATTPCAGAAGAAAAATARRGAPIRLGRPRHGQRRAVRGRTRLRAVITLPRGMRLAGATVRARRLLFERRGRGELTRARGSRAPRPLELRRTGPGRFSAASRSGRLRTRIVLRRMRYGRASLSLTAGARAFRAPHACHALPASVAPETQPLWLHTRLVIGDGRRRQPVVLRHHVRCRRDARGNVHRLEYMRYRRHTPRGGLAVTLRGPRSVRPGTTARYVARVHNRRRTGDRTVSSLWDIGLTAGARAKRIRELRRGRTRTFAFTARVPRNARTVRVPGTPRGRFCVRVGASAPGVRADGTRVCSRVQAARPPSVTG